MDLSFTDEFFELYQKFGHLYPKDAVIFREGDEANEVYFILNGKVKITKKTAKGEEVLAVLEKGVFFGEISVLTNSHRTASAVAATPVRVLRMNRQSFQQSMEKFPKLAMAVLQEVAQRLKSTTEKLSAGQLEDVQAESLGPPLPKKKQDKQIINPEHFFTKKINCPVCGDPFEGVLVRKSAYRFKGRDTDFMPYYEGVNPLFYAVWVCPSCLYAGYKEDFCFLPQNLVRKIKDHYLPDREGLKVSLWGERDVLAALKAYELATATMEARGARESKLGSLYLRQAWLYRLQKKQEEEQFFLQKAEACYEKASQKEDLENTKIGSVGVIYLVGELNRRLGRLEKALRWFSAAIQDPLIKKHRDVAKLAYDELLWTRQSLEASRGK